MPDKQEDEEMVKTTISLDKKTMEELDRLARETNRTRSGMIKQLVEDAKRGKQKVDAR